MKCPVKDCDYETNNVFALANHGTTHKEVVNVLPYIPTSAIEKYGRLFFDKEYIKFDTGDRWIFECVTMDSWYRFRDKDGNAADFANPRLFIKPEDMPAPIPVCVPIRTLKDRLEELSSHALKMEELIGDIVKDEADNTSMDLEEIEADIQKTVFDIQTLIDEL